jgi:hypothetical protein
MFSESVRVCVYFLLILPFAGFVWCYRGRLSNLGSLSLAGSFSGTIPTEMYVRSVLLDSLVIIVGVSYFDPLLLQPLILVSTAHILCNFPFRVWIRIRSGHLSDLHSLSLRGSFGGSIPLEMYVCSIF